MFTAEISKHKGPPVFNELERYKMVRAIKWVDEVRLFSHPSLHRPQNQSGGGGGGSIRSLGYKTFFMLNSAELEVLMAHKY